MSFKNYEPKSENMNQYEPLLPIWVNLPCFLKILPFSLDFFVYSTHNSEGHQSPWIFLIYFKRIKNSIKIILSKKFKRCFGKYITNVIIS
jgi:hypothetical protein